MSCIENSDSHFNYPFTKRVSQVDDYFGTKVEDPYRWLEDLDSKEVLSWSHSQQDFTQDYLNKILFTSKIEKKLKAKWNYERMSMPFRKGNRFFIIEILGFKTILYYITKMDLKVKKNYY